MTITIKTFKNGKKIATTHGGSARAVLCRLREVLQAEDLTELVFDVRVRYFPQKVVNAWRELIHSDNEFVSVGFNSLRDNLRLFTARGEAESHKRYWDAA